MENGRALLQASFKFFFPPPSLLSLPRHPFFAVGNTSIIRERTSFCNERFKLAGNLSSCRRLRGRKKFSKILRQTVVRRTTDLGVTLRSKVTAEHPVTRVSIALRVRGRSFSVSRRDTWILPLASQKTSLEIRNDERV